MRGDRLEGHLTGAAEHAALMARARHFSPLIAITRDGGEGRTTLTKAGRVRIDYRLDAETYASPPPGGELVIATPERLEALLRNPVHDPWFATIGAVCADEAHLIASPRRGPTLEFLLTSPLCRPAPPRLILLSATLGDLEGVRAWLDPCDIVAVTERQPPLHKEVIEVAPG